MVVECGAEDVFDGLGIVEVQFQVIACSGELLAGERQIELDACAELAEIERVDPAAGCLVDRGLAKIQADETVGVVAPSSDQRVVARAAIQQVVAAATDQRIVARAA